MTKEKVKNIICCVLGTAIYCVGVNLFITPSGLYSGGFVGISQLLALLTKNTPLAAYNVQGVIYLILNIPLFIIGWIKLGRHLIEKSIAVTILESILFSVLPVPEKMLLDELATNAIAGGILSGLGTVLLFIGFGSSGGTDILGFLLTSKNQNFSVGKVSAAVNLCVYVACGILFNINTAVYSFTAAIFSSVVVDRLHIQNRAVSVNIMSEKTNDISNMILHEINRDATILDGTGAYSGKKKNMIVSIMSEYELEIVRKRVKQIDPNAFIYVHPNITVMGNFEKRLTEKN